MMPDVAYIHRNQLDYFSSIRINAHKSNKAQQSAFIVSECRSVVFENVGSATAAICRY